MMIIMILAVIIIAILFAMYRQQIKYHEHVENINSTQHALVIDLLDSWIDERSKLLDRIQAPTFAEYKNAEIKMVKAQKDEEPKPSFILE